VALYEIILTRAGVETKEQAEGLLRGAGIDPSELMIVEELDEEEE
jgi:hypothetical protein